MNQLHLTLICSMALWVVLCTVLITVLLHQPFLPGEFAKSPEGKTLFVPSPHAILTPSKTNESIISAIAPVNSPSQFIFKKYHLLDEPNALATFQAYNAVLTDNRQLFALFKGHHAVTGLHQQKQTPLKIFGHRPVSHLPLSFWMMALTSLTALLVGVGIWRLQHRQRSAQLLLLSGALFSIGVLLTAFYSHRHVVLDPVWFEASMALQHLTLGSFPYALLALLLSYPKKLISGQAVLFIFLIPLLFWLNEQLWQIDLPIHSFYLNSLLALLLGSFGAYGQWRAAHHDPLALAGLRWFLISIYTAPLIAVALYLVPPMFGAPPQLPTWAAQMLFLSLFLGFAMGVARYRLFDVERWWFRAWLWFLAGVVLLCLDLVLVSLLHLPANNALTLSLVIMAWGYFPARQWIWSALADSQPSHPSDYLPLMIEQLFEQPPKGRSKMAWQVVLDNVFQVNKIEKVPYQGERAHIMKEGLYLYVPDLSGPERREKTAFQLSGRANGTRLFGRSDAELADNLRQLSLNLLAVHSARQTGAQIERQRIIRDLHDDVGANLLSLTYRAETREQAELARETLKLLRETVELLDDDQRMSLEDACFSWQAETKRRCDLAKIKMQWQQSLKETTWLTPRQRINIGRILREGVTNAIKHRPPNTLLPIHIRIHQNHKQLQLHIDNESNGTNPSAWSARKGVNNIKTRAKELSGTAEWLPKNSTVDGFTPQVNLSITIPLQLTDKHHD